MGGRYRRSLPGPHRGARRRSPRNAQSAHFDFFSDENTNIRSLEAKTELDQGGGIVEMTVDVKDKKQLEKLVTAMRRISGVRDVERLFN